MTTFFDDFCTIDTSRPWLEPYLSMHKAFGDAPKLPLHEWLNAHFDTQGIRLYNHQNHPLSFTHQHDLEHGTAYETHIDTHHKIPTRDNLHDWFGACVWSVFPKTKALLNAKHLAYMNEGDSANKRNRVRDAITVFDENGAILVVSDETLGSEIAQALANFDWQTCLIDHRSHWSDYKDDTTAKAKLFIFGHALLEQLIKPYKSLCSHTFIVQVPPTFFDESPQNQLTFLDDYLAYRLDKFLIDTVTPRQFNPLPVLGVPHFWDNANPDFYDDPFVFRSGRKNK